MSVKQLIGIAMIAVPAMFIAVIMAPKELLGAAAIVGLIVYVLVALSLVCND